MGKEKSDFEKAIDESISESKITDLKERLEFLEERLSNGRDYLMQVQGNEITVEDTLIAFGWNSNGYLDR
mgnify:CR=1 FL=1